jgi:hypothetical protein
MKDIYVILAFHAHELLWDLPEKLLSYLDDGNPMKDTILDQNYIKKRKEEDRDVYTLGIELGEKLDAPICVEYTNELLQQINAVIPEIFHKIKGHFHSGRLYPLYGHAHHTHVSLLTNEEITQEIIWNMQYLHNFMDVPYPKYKGLFSPEASYSYSKIEGAAAANIDYLIFPHLAEEKCPFQIEGKGDYIYKPFLIKTAKRYILALPRNFLISQEIWRPITRMKRDEVKNQGYRLGDYAVFFNEYLTGQPESYPIEMDEAVELYKGVLRQELNQAPPDALLVYIQDLELMDFGDIAIKILARSWEEVLQEDREKYRVRFVTPDQYIDQVLIPEGVEKLPSVHFDKVCWAPEIRLVLRADGHYPPLGVNNTGRYSTEKSGMYEHPHVFWENGKYFCGIFDTLVQNFNITVNLSAHGERFNETGYELSAEDLDTQAIMYLRFMKRACNWGWRPTEGRQKRPCLDGYLLCDVLLKKIDRFPGYLTFSREPANLEPRHIAGLVETLRVFIDLRLEYLRYGLEKYMAEQGGDLSGAYRGIEEVNKWKEVAIQKARDLYQVNRNENMTLVSKMKQVISLVQDYCQAVFMATESIQKVWGVVPDADYIVDRMYEYLYEIYPPLFPAMLTRIDRMTETEIRAYFEQLDVPESVGEPQFVKVGVAAGTEKRA